MLPQITQIPRQLLYSLLVVCPLLVTSCQKPIPEAARPVVLDMDALPYPKLSDYGFFKGALHALEPNARVVPYTLITPLFTDYAHKARFLWMPEGVQGTVDTQGTIDFPDQSVLIKNFYYPADFRKPAKNWDMVETRLLIKNKGQWEAYTYVWNASDTDADFIQVGDIKPVSWKDEQGVAQHVDYIVPNKNQCKSCHNINNTFQPIGPKVRNLNSTLTYQDGVERNQIDYLQTLGYLKKGDYRQQFAPVADWDDPHSGTLNARALAYLDINCGHCHNPNGPAHTTGLYLTAYQHNPALLGVHKPPVAAGKGSGNRHFGIEPGRPDASILLYRMQSNDPGEMMPELGRAIAHEEGVSLIREWIAHMAPEKSNLSNQ